MRVSLRRFASDPYKYAKKAPIKILIGDDVRYVLVPYLTYKERVEAFIPQTTKQSTTLTETPPQETRKTRGWLYRLLFA